MENNKLKIVLGTNNPHKLAEIKEIAKNYDIEFVLPGEDFDPIEDGENFEQNSYIKAATAARITKNIALADDSGLCVQALKGAPGIYSARYEQTPQKRIDKLLKNLKNEQNRSAKFVCDMTLVDETGNIINHEVGECCGKISEVQSGINGFGYDPIFVPNGYEITMAEMSEDLKNSISHRSVALQKMLEYIKNTLVL